MIHSGGADYNEKQTAWQGIFCEESFSFVMKPGSACISTGEAVMSLPDKGTYIAVRATVL